MRSKVRCQQSAGPQHHLEHNLALQNEIIAPLSGESGRSGNIAIVVTAADDEEMEEDEVTGDRD